MKVALHRQTMARHSPYKTETAEQMAQQSWREAQYEAEPDARLAQNYSAGAATLKEEKMSSRWMVAQKRRSTWEATAARVSEDIDEKQYAALVAALAEDGAFEGAASLQEKLARRMALSLQLNVDDMSFIGRAFFAKMHYRMQQGR